MRTDYLLPFDPSIQLGQPFGARPGLTPNPAGGHNGDDWLVQIGTPVRAPGDGTVIFAGQFDDTYADNFGWNLNYGGNMVVLNMDGDTEPYFEYAHLSEFRVQTGDRVTGGQVIALSGNSDGGTGMSTGPHCHVGCLPWDFNLGSNTYGRINPRICMTRYYDSSMGSINSAGTVTEEDDMATAEQVWKHELDLDGKLFAAGDILVYSRKNAELARIAAEAAPAKAVQMLLSTKLQAPDGSGTYTIADYIIFGWMYSMKSKDGVAAAMGNFNTDQIVEAVVKASQDQNLQTIADHLKIVVGEEPK